MEEVEAADKTSESRSISHAILDLRDEMREKRRPVDCISSNRIEE